MLKIWAGGKVVVTLHVKPKQYGMPLNGMVKKSTIEDIIREDLADIWSILNSEEKHLIAE